MTQKTSSALRPVRVDRRTIDPELYQRALDRGHPELVARVLAGRGLDDVTFDLERLDDPALLADIDAAADRVIAAIAGEERIALSGDHDADGVCSCVVLHRGLERLGAHPDNLIYAISHRLRQGYGLNASLAEDLIENVKPSLVVTADNGSSDEERIARLKAAGIDTVVTDHHQIPADNPPVSAVAFVNPQRADCAYPDKSIAGCFVAWHLVRHVRDRMVKQGLLPASTSNMDDLLPYVAVGTQADCVSLASPNNRAVLQHGLRQINAQAEPCWESIADMLPAKSETLAFQVCPRIAAAGRLDEAIPGIKWLLSSTLEEANERFQVLTEANDNRKGLEREMVNQAVPQAVIRVRKGHMGLSVYLPLGHTGTHGIVASRLVERFGMPTVMLAPKAEDPNVIAGSARSIPGFHLRNALQQIQDEENLMTAFGGHPMAAGLSLPVENLDAFRAAFNRVVSATIDPDAVGPVVTTDGSLEPWNLSLDLVEELESLEPYGQEFPSPSFDDFFVLKSMRPIGDGTHMRMSLERDGVECAGVWFRFRDNPQLPIPVEEGQTLHVVYTLSANTFRNTTSLQLLVNHARPVSSAELALMAI